MDQPVELNAPSLACRCYHCPLFGCLDELPKCLFVFQGLELGVAVDIHSKIAFLSLPLPSS